MTGEEIKKQVYDAVACDDMFYRPELRDAIYDMVDENAKLRELCKSMRCALADHEDKVYLAALDETLIGAGFDLQKLGIEAG